MKSISFLIPAYRDQSTVASVIGEARDAGRKLGIPFEIIVINDASPDDTGRVLRQLTPTIRQLSVITHTENKGYGGTIRELYYAARNEWLFTIPGDHQIPPKEVFKLIPKTDKADMILGLRANRQDSPARLRQSKIYNTLLTWLFHPPVHDVNSVRLMKRSILQKITLTTSSAFVDAELVIQAARAGFRVTQTPISHRNRQEEAGAGGGSMRTVLPTIIDMIVFWMNSLVIPAKAGI